MLMKASTLWFIRKGLTQWAFPTLKNLIEGLYQIMAHTPNPAYRPNYSNKVLLEYCHIYLLISLLSMAKSGRSYSPQNRKYLLSGPFQKICHSWPKHKMKHILYFKKWDKYILIYLHIGSLENIHIIILH